MATYSITVSTTQLLIICRGCSGPQLRLRLLTSIVVYVVHNSIFLIFIVARVDCWGADLQGVQNARQGWKHRRGERRTTLLLNLHGIRWMTKFSKFCEKFERTSWKPHPSGLLWSCPYKSEMRWTVTSPNVSTERWADCLCVAPNLAEWHIVAGSYEA